ncbi:hypothetical protein [Amaricoccus sp.]|uniref:hypothetical protein n=1 Tax=Amaricoccus sp. TaxID=1872485 RepID=UPI001B51FBDD|nr:hypothetical protein [Amaricoccus sp.]MBP7242041.1 hypothetical protein [Amaricoccus sp.]
MTDVERGELARVTYRATLPDGREAGLEFALTPDAATPVDAWRRLTAVYGAIDVRTLEIEVRRRALAPHLPAWRRAPMLRVA